MKLFATTATLAIISVSTAFAETRRETLCGADDVNEATSRDDVTANPDQPRRSSYHSGDGQSVQFLYKKRCNAGYGRKPGDASGEGTAGQIFVCAQALPEQWVGFLTACLGAG